MPICKRCGKETEFLSRRGLCGSCGMGGVYESVKQMQAKSGPIYEKWQARYSAAREIKKSQA